MGNIDASRSMFNYRKYSEGNLRCWRIACKPEKRVRRETEKGIFLSTLSHRRLLSGRHRRLLAGTRDLLGFRRSVTRADSREENAGMCGRQADCSDCSHPEKEVSLCLVLAYTKCDTHIPSSTMNSLSLRMSSPPHPPAISGRLQSTVSFMKAFIW